MSHLFIRQLAYWIIHLEAWDEPVQEELYEVDTNIRTTKAEKLAHFLRLTALSVQTLLMTNV